LERSVLAAVTAAQKIKLINSAIGDNNHNIGLEVDERGKGAGCCCTGKDDGVGSFDVLEDHGPDLYFDVGGLVSHRHFRDARQIDQREIEHVRRVDLGFTHA
jgi:hypothetical protein